MKTGAKRKNADDNPIIQFALPTLTAVKIPAVYQPTVPRRIAETGVNVAVAVDGLLSDLDSQTRQPVIGHATVVDGQQEPSRGTYYLYVEDADAAMARAVAVGGRSLGPVANRPFAHRSGYQGVLSAAESLKGAMPGCPVG